MNLTPDRWQHIARIYDLAVEVGPAARDAHLSDACGGDEELRREVESLLRQDDAAVVVDRPVWSRAAQLLDDGPELHPGTSTGRFTDGHRASGHSLKFWRASSAYPDEDFTRVLTHPGGIHDETDRRKGRSVPIA
ncbi:MAG: hypothetical protein ABW318_12210, partial [Vicinamibacterales bacterium]